MDRPPPGVKTGKPESYLRFLLMGNRSFETAPKNQFPPPAPTPATGLTVCSRSKSSTHMLVAVLPLSTV